MSSEPSLAEANEPVSRTAEPVASAKTLDARAVVTRLIDAISLGEALIAVTGATDSGRTALKAALRAELERRSIGTLEIASQDRGGISLKDIVAQALAKPPSECGLDDTDHFFDLMLGSPESGRQRVLIIDDAEQLRPDALSGLRLLCQLAQVKLQIVFLAKPEFLHAGNDEARTDIRSLITACWQLEQDDAVNRPVASAGSIGAEAAVTAQEPSANGDRNFKRRTRARFAVAAVVLAFTVAGAWQATSHPDVLASWQYSALRTAQDIRQRALGPTDPSQSVAQVVADANVPVDGTTSSAPASSTGRDATAVETRPDEVAEGAGSVPVATGAGAASSPPAAASTEHSEDAGPQVAAPGADSSALAAPAASDAASGVTSVNSVTETAAPSTPPDVTENAPPANDAAPAPAPTTTTDNAAVPPADTPAADGTAAVEPPAAGAEVPSPAADAETHQQPTAPEAGAASAEESSGQPAVPATAAAPAQRDEAQAPPTQAEPDNKASGQATAAPDSTSGQPAEPVAQAPAQVAVPAPASAAGSADTPAPAAPPPAPVQPTAALNNPSTQPVEQAPTQTAAPAQAPAIGATDTPVPAVSPPAPVQPTAAVNNTSAPPAEPVVQAPAPVAVPAPAPASSVAVAPAPAGLPPVPAPAPPQAAAATVTAPPIPLVQQAAPANLVALLMSRGQAMLELGDISAARLLFERAAELGNARGATEAGKTYDPDYLRSARARGIAADPARAAAWYRKAAALGDTEAAGRLARMPQ